MGVFATAAPVPGRLSGVGTAVPFRCLGRGGCGRTAFKTPFRMASEDEPSCRFGPPPPYELASTIYWAQ